MLDNIEHLAQLLQGSFLEGSEIRQLKIDESDQIAFAIKVKASEVVEAWDLLRSHLKQTGRYPIVTEGWGADDVFSRFYYKEEAFDGKLQDISPESIITSIPTSNLENFWEKRNAYCVKRLEDSIARALEETGKHFGSCPDEAQIRELVDNGTISSCVDLEKWLFHWELQNFSTEDALCVPSTEYFQWEEPYGRDATLLLLPIENGWDSLAYLHWWGACSAGTNVAIDFLKQWNQKYDAEIVCHYGTMLQFKVGKRPLTPEDAFDLACGQEALAECTTILPGISLRNHARSLLIVDRWFLHERP